MKSMNGMTAKILTAFLFTVLVISFGAGIKGFPVLAYVYSDSMEPLLHVNDAFLVLPVNSVQTGDIVMYRPAVLEAPFITHRVVGSGENGFITKGDNSPYRDQEGAEPEVQTDRIVGRVLTINGWPLVLPGFGNVSAAALSLFGNYSKALAALFLLLGIMTLLFGKRPLAPGPRPRRRIRLGQVYRAVVLMGIGVIVLSIFLGSRVSTVKYLVSEYPGSLGNQIEVNKPGQLKLEARNNGLFPVRTVITGIAPLSTADAPKYLGPLSSQAVIMDVSRQREAGMQQGYVQIYNYPVLLPGAWIAALHRVNPMLAVLCLGLAMGIWLSLFFRLLQKSPGLAAWVPLKAIQDKILRRRMHRIRAMLLGRRRAR